MLVPDGGLAARVRTTVICCVVALPAALLVAATFVEAKGTDGESLLFRYQTLIAGVFALIAAFIGAGAINRQIQVARELEVERIGRTHVAARAVTPLALNKLLGYAAEVIVAIETARSGIVDSNQWRQTITSLEFPTVPYGVVGDLRNMIEAANATDAEAFAQLLRDLQVQVARLSSVKKDLENSLTSELRGLRLTRTQFEAILLYASASELFDYARGISDVADATPTWPAMTNAIFGLGLAPTSKIVELIEARAEDGKPPTMSDRPPKPNA